MAKRAEYDRLMAGWQAARRPKPINDGVLTVKYKSNRARAWRNAMVAAINAGLEQKVFSLDPDESGIWGSRETQEERNHDRGDRGRVYEFKIDDIPAIAAVWDIGYDELRINVALWPVENAKERIQVSNPGFRAGKMFASGWLERRQRKWLQHYRHISMRCRGGLTSVVAALDVKPMGFADSGKFFL